MLRHFISAQAKIMPRKRSHLCAKHQRRLAMAIKRSRFMALLPFSAR
jgi:small subunit ribosomal protein S18